MIVEQISARLALPVSYLLKLASTASHRYREYEIDKRTGGKRTINHPARELKLVQRWLLRHVLTNLPIHEVATAYRPGFNIVGNAERHVANSYLLRVDFQDFFPSLKASDVDAVLRANRANLTKGEATDQDIDFTTRIVCRRGCLTIGAPTSPHVSNAIMFDFDVVWSRIAEEHDVVYTRYADDLYFSTNRPKVLQQILDRLREYLRTERTPLLRINDKKTVFSSRKYRRLAAGLVLTSDRKISIGRDKKRMLRVLVNRLKRRELDAKQILHLRGWIAYLHSVEPTFLASLEKKYDLDFRVNDTWQL